MVNHKKYSFWKYSITTQNVLLFKNVLENTAWKTAHEFNSMASCLKRQINNRMISRKMENRVIMNVCCQMNTLVHIEIKC